MVGTIIKNTGNDCWVRTENGITEMCKIKGNFRIKSIKSTNPVAVGDKVEVNSSGFISRIFDRKNCIVRRPVNLSKQIHILAANVDIALLVVTIKSPAVSTIFIDRFIASAEAFSVPVILVFNKIDLLNQDDEIYLDLLIKLYKSINYECIKTSLINMDIEYSRNGVGEIKKNIAGKIVLLAGNSGVGKSSMINVLTENSVAKTAKISDYHQKGKHTTTFSEMFCADKTFIIDTPGIKGFGTIDMHKSEIGHYFREIFVQSKHCHFPNCTHRHEPNCAVLQAVEDKKIALSRYQSYLSIIEDTKDGKYRSGKF